VRSCINISRLDKIENGATQPRLEEVTSNFHKHSPCRIVSSARNISITRPSEEKMVALGCDHGSCDKMKSGGRFRSKILQK
jgi:hypothetical protein